MTTDDASSPSDNDTPPPQARTVAPVTLREGARRLGILAGSAAVLGLGGWFMQPAVGLTSETLWGALLGDPWVIGGLRFVGAVTSAFLLASIVVLTCRGRWIDRAGGVQTASSVAKLRARDAAVDPRLESQEETIRELLALLDEETRPDPSGS